MTETSKITKADILAGYNNPGWNGFGYLGDRKRTQASKALIAKADARLLQEANAAGWTHEQFFTWLNSKYGRWYADAWFGGGQGAALERDIRDTITLKDLGV
jgi:hypothetical protein